MYICNVELNKGVWSLMLFVCTADLQVTQGRKKLHLLVLIRNEPEGIYLRSLYRKYNINDVFSSKQNKIFQSEFGCALCARKTECECETTWTVLGVEEHDSCFIPVMCQIYLFIQVHIFFSCLNIIFH